MKLIICLHGILTDHHFCGLDSAYVAETHWRIDRQGPKHKTIWLGHIMWQAITLWPRQDGRHFGRRHYHMQFRWWICFNFEKKYWTLFVRVKLTIILHWLRQWPLPNHGSQCVLSLIEQGMISWPICHSELWHYAGNFYSSNVCLSSRSDYMFVNRS